LLFGWTDGLQRAPCSGRCRRWPKAVLKPARSKIQPPFAPPLPPRQLADRLDRAVAALGRTTPLPIAVQVGGEDWAARA
jgi:hypothetical protein